MPFYVKWEPEHKPRQHAKVYRATLYPADGEHYRLMTRVYNPLALIWSPVGAGEDVPAMIPSITVRTRPDVGCGAINQEEAEEATGLHAPACWDKIMDEL